MKAIIFGRLQTMPPPLSHCRCSLSADYVFMNFCGCFSVPSHYYTIYHWGSEHFDLWPQRKSHPSHQDTSFAYMAKKHHLITRYEMLESRVDETSLLPA